MSDGKHVLELVPEVYFDLIARVVPGVVAAVAIVGGVAVSGALQEIGKIGLVLIGLLGAYAVGLVLDVAGDTISENLISVWNATSQRKVRKNLELCQRIDQIDDRHLAALFTKLMAERVLVRSLSLLSLLALAFPAWPAATVPWSAKLISAAVFGLLAIRLEYHLRVRMSATSSAPTGRRAQVS